MESELRPDADTWSQPSRTSTYKSRDFQKTWNISPGIMYNLSLELQTIFF